MKVFTAQQMRDFDREAVEKYGIPSLVLMENAALRVVEFLEAKFAPLADKKIVILCGKGNNGGDGLAIARHLVKFGALVSVRLMYSPDEFKGDAEIQWRAIKSGVDELNIALSWNKTMLDDAFGAVSQEAEADIVIDALLGTGFIANDNSIEAPLLFSLDFLQCFCCPMIAVDLASGLDADSGQMSSQSCSPDFTITFAAAKRGLFVRQGVERSGEIWIGAIGAFDEQLEETRTGVETLDLESAKNLVPKRPIDAHKGDAGRVLVVGGSLGMSGAIGLASRASLKVGAGLCQAAIPTQIMASFASLCPEATSFALPDDSSGQLLLESLEKLPEKWENVQVVALGPGIGRSEETQKLVREIAANCPQTLVIDADALHALPKIFEKIKNREAETILTPHPGEMGVLMGLDAKSVNDDRFEVVKNCALKYGAWVVLKGARSLVSSPEGEIWVNLTGNSGMATGGSGDVLTGTIAGLVAQCKDAGTATKLGVYLHGLAGDLAFGRLGNGLIAGDICDALPLALKEIESREVEKINGRLRKLE